MHVLRKPYLLYLGDAILKSDCKTAFGLRDWCPQDVLGEWSHPQGSVTLGLPRLSPAEAATKGAGSIVIGVAPTGGQLPEHWQDDLEAALEAGLDVVSGLHTRLGSFARLRAAAQRHGVRLIDVRHPTREFPVASGRKRSGKRVLTVGTDCALGKKYTALALARALGTLGVPATFRATGQTGILIAGSGIPLDAVVSDFVAGAAEQLSPDANDDHWDIVEGQGSLFHPSYAGVSLGLLHGTQPDVIVLCHEEGRERILGLEDYPLPSLADAISLNHELARRTNPRVRCAGISLNTAALDAARARAVLAERKAQLGLPVADPMRNWPELEELVTSCLSSRANA